MWIGLYVLDHNPAPGECYIADIVVHSDYRWIMHLLFKESKWDYMVQKREGHQRDHEEKENIDVCDDRRTAN